jgi:hypothetical protein
MGMYVAQCVRADGTVTAGGAGGGRLCRASRRAVVTHDDNDSEAEGEAG